MEFMANPSHPDGSRKAPSGFRTGWPTGVRSFGMKSLLALVIGLWCLAAWLYTGFYAEQNASQWVSRRQESAKVSAALIAENIGRLFALGRSVPILLSEEAGLLSQLNAKFGPEIKPSTLTVAELSKSLVLDPELRTLAGRLQSIVDKVGLASLFVMNAAGDCVAQGHEAGNKALTGVNMADREYFQAEQDGKVGRQFEVDRATGSLALFYAAPVFSDRKFIGAVGAKINLGHLAKLIPEPGFFMTDENGVIILAKDPELNLLAVPDAKVFKLSEKERESRYKRKQFELVQFVSSGEQGSVPLVSWGGARWPSVMASQYVAGNFVKVYVLRGLEEILRLRQERYGWFALFAFAGVVTFLLIAVVALFIKGERKYRHNLLIRE